MSTGKRPELTGGGLVRSSGGWGVLKAMRRMKVHLKSDERILGDSDFVEAVLASAQEELDNRYRLQAIGFDFNATVKRAADAFNLNEDQILLPGKQPQRVLARSVLAYWAVRKLGLTITEVGKRIGLSQPATSRAVSRGEQITREHDLDLLGE